jgi:hypothetical protein
MTDAATTTEPLYISDADLIRRMGVPRDKGRRMLKAPRRKSAVSRMACGYSATGRVPHDRLNRPKSPQSSLERTALASRANWGSV